MSRQCDLRPEAAMITPEAIAEARRQLGRHLAALRRAAGYNSQHDLAPLTFYGRSTIANVETGRQHARRAFWQRCDEVLGTGGVLAAGYDEIEAMMARQRDEAVQAFQANRSGVIGRGQRDDRPDGGPCWTSDLGQALREAAALWGEELAAGAGEAIDVAAAGEIAFRWLVAPRDGSPARGDSRRRVGQSDVERLRAVRRTLKAADNAHGGGAALPMAIAYLRREVRPLLDGRYDDGTGTALFGVTAELTLDVGWMAYDNADHGLAADYMGHALRLSHAADDRLFGGRVLAAMSHQALHLGHVRLSVDLANGTRGGSPSRWVPPRARWRRLDRVRTIRTGWTSTRAGCGATPHGRTAISTTARSANATRSGRSRCAWTSTAAPAPNDRRSWRPVNCDAAMSSRLRPPACVWLPQRGA